MDNDLAYNVLKFADDTKLYGIVDCQLEGQCLQQDIDRLGNWARDWKMKFNIDKCKVMHYGKDNIAFKYSLYGQQLAEESSEKDLGVTFSSDLKVNIQCREAYSKASQALGLVNRTIKHKNPAILLPLYKTIVPVSYTHLTLPTKRIV